MSGEQMDLDLEAAGRAAADAAVEQVAASAGPDEVQRLVDAVHRTARELTRFTSDDVWERLDGGRPHEPRAMGAAMRQARAAGFCTPSGGYRTSRNPAAHARPVREWLSLVTSLDMLEVREDPGGWP